MGRFLIHCETNWCGMDETYRAEAKSELDLYDVAEQLAYDNFLTYELYDYIAEDQGYDPDDMTDEDWEVIWENCSESDYYSFYIEEFTGDDYEWEMYQNAE